MTRTLRYVGNGFPVDPSTGFADMTGVHLDTTVEVTSAPGDGYVRVTTQAGNEYVLLEQDVTHAEETIRP